MEKRVFSSVVEMMQYICKDCIKRKNSGVSELCKKCSERYLVGEDGENSVYVIKK